MDQKDVEMEDAGQLLEDEMVGGQECIKKDEIAVDEEGDKQQESSGLVKADAIVQSPNETGVEKEVQDEPEMQEVEDEPEEHKVQEEPEMQEVQAEPEEHEVQDVPEMQVQAEPEEHEVQEVQAEPEEHEVQDVQEEPEMQEEQEVQEEPEVQEEQDVQEEPEEPEVQEEHEMQEVQEETRNEDTEEVHRGKSERELPVYVTQDIKKDDTTTTDENKIVETKNDTSVMTCDDKIDDSKNDATEMAADDKMTADDKIHDVDDTHGVTEETDHGGSMKIPENNDAEDYTGDEKRQQIHTPNVLMTYSLTKSEDHILETPKNELDDTKMDEGYESGTAEEQEAFNREVEAVYRAKHMEFKPPKFYGQQLNCLKLWRSVIKLGGYDRVTGAKWWRQIGESFHPPKTCTTVSWTFRQFYEKALLEYERHKVQNREIELPLANVFPEAPTLTVDIEANGHQTPGSGSGRARRDAAARAMQGWHAQRLLGFGGEEKISNYPQKREKSLKSIGSSLKHKRPSEMEYSAKAARTETSRQVVTTVADVGVPANWVKINVRETKDCFEVYALVPGLLREQVRVQSDPAGRLVITGQPEQVDNPWGISAFKKVISLPGRIDPLRTSAIVSLHGRLLVRVPFEQSNI